MQPIVTYEFLVEIRGKIRRNLECGSAQPSLFSTHFIHLLTNFVSHFALLLPILSTLLHICPFCPSFTPPLSPFLSISEGCFFSAEHSSTLGSACSLLVLKLKMHKIPTCRSSLDVVVVVVWLQSFP